MAILRIVKRTGDIVPFDRGRIHGAVTKAIRAVGAPVEASRIHAIVDGVVADAEARFGEAPPTVEHVQDLVEKALVREGLYEVAKAYILYRADRQRERDAQRAAAVERARLGRLTVRTRDGATVPFDTARLVAAVTARVGDLAPDVSVDALVGEALRTIFDGMATTQIERALVLAAAAFIERDPAYSVAASRLQLDALFREVTQASPGDGDRDARYRDAFAAGLRRGIGSGLYDARLAAFDHAALAAALRPERDALLQYLGVQTLADRYLARDDGRTVELPQAFWMRVAMGLAVDEDEPTARAIAFYDLMSTLRYVPSTPTLFHAGTPRPQLSSCYLTTVQDDLAHIFKALGDNAQLSKWSGGLGNDWTSIRGTGARIASTRVESQGVVPFLKVANDVTMAINRSGKRRGATCAYLEAWHYDIEDFLELRRNTGDERRRTHDMNTAVWIPDLFMARVEADGPWTLFSPDEVPDLHEIYGRAFAERYREAEARAARGELHLHRTVPATALWRKMLTMLFETGHPWITFKDPCNVRSPQDHAGVVHSSNLCTEITLNTSAEETAVCNLGSVNLARHVVDGRLDEAALGETVTLAMRMLDNVVDINFYPTPEARTSNLRHRPVGLGLMGWQDALFELDLPFDAPEAVALADRTMEVISYHAILASSRLAAERGPYASYAGSKWDRGLLPFDTLALLDAERGTPVDVNRTRRLDWAPVYASVAAHGMRNSNTMAIAPTATIANIAGCYPCIEPIYRNIYVKANISGEFTIVNAHLVRDLKALGLWSADMLDHLKYFDGNLRMIAGVPGPAEGEVPRDVRDRSDRRAAGDGGARQVDRSEPGAHRLHEGRLGAQAERGLPDGVAPRPQDHVLPAHPRGLAGREVDPRRRPLRLHPDARVRPAPVPVAAEVRRCAASTIPTASRASSPMIINSAKTDPNKILPIRYPWARQYYKAAIANNWTPEEVSMQKDVEQWKSTRVLSDAERRLVLYNLGFFSTAESLTANNIVLAVYQHVTSPEARQYLLRQAFEEAIHTDTFIYGCDSLSLDPDEVYNMYIRIPSIAAKDDFVVELTRTVFEPGFVTTGTANIQRFLRDLVGFYVIMEGIFFYAGFAMMLALRRQNKMVGLGEQFEYIMRDESLHLAFGCDLIATIGQENPGVWTPEFKAEIEGLIERAVGLEQAYAREACPDGVLGLNAAQFAEYVEYVADRRLERLGLPKRYLRDNPFPWMSQATDLSKEKNFFETRVTEYQTGASLAWD